MDRRDFFFLQKVQEDELDDAFSGAEDALFNISLDVGFFGVMFGLAVLEQSPTPDLTVRVIGPGAAIDQVGQRAATAGTQTVDLSVDSSSVSTAVAGAPNEKIVSLFIEFARANSDPRIDGNSVSLFFVNDESFSFFVTQGAEGIPPATPPPLEPDKVLLADVTRTFAQTQIFDAQIAAGDTALGGAITDRRQDHIVIDTTFVDIRTGSFAAALLALAQEIDTFVAGAAASITYAGGPNWADGTTNPTTDVEAQLDKIISDLATGAGTAKVQGAALAGSPDSVSSGTLAAQLASLLGHINDRLELTGGTVSGDIIPGTPGTDAIGSVGNEWDGFFDNLSVINASTFTGGANTFTNAFDTPVAEIGTRIDLGPTTVSGIAAQASRLDQFYDEATGGNPIKHTLFWVWAAESGDGLTARLYLRTLDDGSDPDPTSLYFVQNANWNGVGLTWNRDTTGIDAHAVEIGRPLSGATGGEPTVKIRVLPQAAGDSSVLDSSWEDRLLLDGNQVRFDNFTDVTDATATFGTGFVTFAPRQVPRAYGIAASDGSGGVTGTQVGATVAISAGFIAVTIAASFATSGFTVVTGANESSSLPQGVGIANKAVNGFDLRTIPIDGVSTSADNMGGGGVSKTVNYIVMGKST